MKFLYQYRTPDNKQHRAVISAPTKDAAYAMLKAQGVKPGRVEEAPGFFNKLFGKGKRWLAILVLGALCLVLGVILVRTRREAKGAPDPDVLDRAQIYGDPGLLRMIFTNDFEAVFSEMDDRFLAAHAIPGRPCFCDRPGLWRVEVADALAAGSSRPVEIAPDDLEEVAKLKRMVNGMKRELCAYLAAGGNAKGYMRRLDQRLASEVATLNRVRTEMERCTDAKVWAERNRELRILGLPMVDFHAEKFSKIPH